MRKGWLVAAFFVSGACGLAYEVVWERWLELQLGSGIVAVTVVVTAFMAGLALGALLFGAAAERSASPLRLFGLLEIATAVGAAILPRLLGPSVGLLLLLTTLMGGTLPVLAAGLKALEDSGGGDVGWLYGFNTLGAVAGCAAAGFVLLPAWGFSAVNLAMAFLQLLTGTAVAAWSPRRAARPASRGAADAPLWLLAVLAVSGFAALGYEVLWFRLLRQIIGATTYAFATMLCALLAGLALGSLADAWAGGRLYRDPARALAWTQAAAGLSAWLLYPAYSVNWGWLRWWSEAYFAVLHSWTLSRLVQFGIAACIVLAPSFFLGAAFPIAARVLAARPGPTGRRLGQAYFANTAGAIIGSLAVGLVLLPRLGARHCVLVLVAANLGAALVLLARTAPRQAGAVAAAALAALLYTRADLAVRDADDPSALYLKDGVMATIGVYRRGPVKVLSTDGLDIQGSDPRNPRSHPKRLGYLPLLLHEGTARRSLQLGLGTGINLAALARGSGRVDAAELLPELPEAARLFSAENDGVLDDPKVRVIIEDARKQVEAESGAYDLIVGDLFFPENEDTSNLYSLEHFRHCREALAPGGLMVQWLPLHQLTYGSLQSITASFVRAFPHVSLWWGLTTRSLPVVALVGAETETMPSPGGLAAKMKPYLPELRALGWGDPRCVLAHRIGSDAAALELAGSAPLNTDDAPFVQFHAPRLESFQAEDPARLASQDRPAWTWAAAQAPLRAVENACRP